MSSDNGVTRRTNRLFKGTANISTSEHETVPGPGTQHLDVRQDVEQVSRSSVRSLNIVAVLNRTELAGQPSQFGQIGHFTQGFDPASGSLAGRAPADQTLSLTDCRLYATVAVSSQLAEKPRCAYGLD